MAPRNKLAGAHGELALLSLLLTLRQECQLKLGKPNIFNTDQGAQFTALAFTSRLEAEGIRISMDGRGRALDNILSNASGALLNMKISTCTTTPRCLTSKLV
jgi:transposase InsO family protein